MDVKLLSSRLDEDRHEHSCEISRSCCFIRPLVVQLSVCRLRCDLRETSASAKINEEDVNEKLAVQRNKLQEFRERSKGLMDAKDIEVCFVHLWPLSL